jgi:cell division septation protein DedD
MDPDTRRLLMFAGGLATVLVVLVAASAMIGHRSGEVPVVPADPRPIRVKPDNPGGMKIDGAENDVFSGGSDTSNAKLAPPAETPDAKALRAGAIPPPLVQPPAPMVATPPVKPAPAPTAPATRTAAATTAMRSAPTPVAPAAPPVAAAAAEAHPAAAGSHAVVQLAALASEAAARNEWQQLAKRMPELLNGRQPVFSRFERDGHVFWRVRTAGFADEAQARAFCDRVRGKGGGCSVADF